MVIKDFYDDDGGFSSSAAAHGSNEVWVDIIKEVSIIDDIVPSFKSSFILKISNGSSISFLKDAWCNNSTRLMDLYPRLYALEPIKSIRGMDYSDYISVNKNLDYRELVMNILTIWNKPHTIKYQLPDEDLDALISVCLNDDFHHMVEEYNELENGSQRIHVFLVPLNDTDMTTKFGKLDKFKGSDFRRWQKKMHFLLTTLKWDNEDYICRGHILNGMSDALFDVYQNVESAKELWDQLEAKYMAEDTSSKKFLVSNFNNYRMVDSRSVMEQYHKLLRILGQYTQHGLFMDEAISVSSNIDKLPPSWKDFKHMLKHNKDELSLV
ncbi:zinc finger, CCHC-type containing protein [Tanacetum coccineum]